MTNNAKLPRRPARSDGRDGHVQVREAKMGDKGRVAVSCSAQVGVPVRVIACGRRSGG